MSNQQQVIQLLRLGNNACSLALQSVADNSHEEPSPSSFSVIRTDFMSLLALIYATATKLAISLKTSSPTYSAAITPLKDMTKHVAALSHCVNMFNINEHGKTFTQEAVSLVRDVLISTQSLLQLLLDIEVSDDRNKWKEEYLVRTGTLHDIIENARSPTGLSKDNSSAVAKIWNRDLGALEDGVREVAEMIENAQCGDIGEDEDDDDDGWDELGLGSSKTLDKDELGRTFKIHTVLRLTALLDKKIASDLLSSQLRNLHPGTLDKFASFSPALLSASDELIASLFSPQDVPSVKKELDSLTHIIHDVKEAVYPLFSETSETAEEAMEKLSLNGQAPGKQRSQKKWFDGCFEQVSKAIESAAVTLNTNTET
ncbi:hypothetical protein K435DRAFT_801486 [Dendrothele bispora CBS 962.96]|uniref:Grap2 and cyclin-D-interacting-domain-containing protein n=1 Tax=Dendrothele bispora (strain CBS 962.96) TaxID=1314807 RepID=A0A4S8LPQ0_DENBC|nr:hypothetical protein K435DRAFT_801486 [Dendrothele bispora CBS 962.96]